MSFARHPAGSHVIHHLSKHLWAEAQQRVLLCSPMPISLKISKQFHQAFQWWPQDHSLTSRSQLGIWCKAHGHSWGQPTWDRVPSPTAVLLHTAKPWGLQETGSLQRERQACVQTRLGKVHSPHLEPTPQWALSCSALLTAFPYVLCWVRLFLLLSFWAQIIQSRAQRKEFHHLHRTMAQDH